MKKRMILTIVVMIVMVLASPTTISQAAPRVAIAEFELSREYREFRDDLDNIFLDSFLDYFSGEQVVLKERLRYTDLFRDKQISGSDLEKLRSNLEADFLILPRLVYFETTEIASFSISIISNSDMNIGVGVNKALLEIEVAARIVCLETGTIHSGSRVSKDELFALGSLSVNNRNLVREKKSAIIEDAFKPALDDLAILTLADLEKISDDIKRTRQEAAVVEIATDKMIIVEIHPKDDRFRVGARVRILRYGKVGGRIPIGYGKVVDRHKSFVTVEVTEDMEVKIGDVISD